MCGLCGVLVNEHWTDAGGAGRRARVIRTALLERALATAGLGVREWAAQYVVTDGKGRSAVATDLAALWVVADQLAGRALDPLDPAVVAAVGGTAA